MKYSIKLDKVAFGLIRWKVTRDGVLLGQGLTATTKRAKIKVQRLLLETYDGQ